jgi:hypothetical protein
MHRRPGQDVGARGQVDGKTTLARGFRSRGADLPRSDEAAGKSPRRVVSLTLNPRQVNPEVNQLYWKGGLTAIKTAKPVRRGIQYFEQAIQKDPGYAPAYAGMALAYASLASVYAPPRGDAEAKGAILRAGVGRYASRRAYRARERSSVL